MYRYCDARLAGVVGWLVVGWWHAAAAAAALSNWSAG